jgi:hypothetical protein
MYVWVYVRSVDLSLYIEKIDIKSVRKSTLEKYNIKFDESQII